jgi:hypothetical protein
MHRTPSPTREENISDPPDDDLVILNEQPAQIVKRHIVVDQKASIVEEGPVKMKKDPNAAIKKRTQDLSRKEMIVLLNYYRVSSHLFGSLLIRLTG